jgi:hypothetical protein
MSRSTDPIINGKSAVVHADSHAVFTAARYPLVIKSGADEQKAVPPTERTENR